MSDSRQLRGRVLKVQNRPDGMSSVVLDNGISNTITVHVFTEDLHNLLNSDTRGLWEHIVTRKPGHFRKK
jgi:hypothetical protein